ncbi:glycoside hydrolase family 16 protein [Crassisporium funariophilum]|nr:glycoside hydrolase family 16 protein [Crassisporium funariophilum]
MSRPSRRQVQQPVPQYAAVPQSPSRVNSHASYQPQPPTQPHVGGPRPVRSTSATSSNRNSRQQTPHQHGRNAIAHGVATGNIGAGYGPYSYHPEQARETGVYTNTRFSTTPSENSVATAPVREKVPPLVVPTTTTVPQYMWDKDPDLDDAMHNPDPRGDSSFTIFSARGWMNASAIFALIFGLITLFIGYPLIWHFTHLPNPIVGFNLGGINASGQIPDLPGLPRLVDDDTPDSVRTRVGDDGKLYDLVFSDEFNTDGRTFYPGEDPFWEAADLHYWPTGDIEWYDPSAITTQGGKLVITMSEKRSHDLNFESGMLTSWNKLCFNTGYIEVSISMPGSPSAPGLWPGAWTLGNLGRAGYGATTQGMWPYSYDSCDLGTFPSQTARDGTPAAAATGGKGGSILSTQPGQKVSACTCPGSDHPGPSVNVGRGVPEIDIIEAQIDTDRVQGEVSQSFQCAPYDLGYNWITTPPATTIYDSNITAINSYTGGPLQQAVSAVSYIDNKFYGGADYAAYGFEFWADPSHREDGFITWYSNNQKTWTVTAATVGPNAESQVQQRLIPEEPMYVILNLGMSPSFQKQDFKHLTFPVSMYIDYVRIYQRRGLKNGITCDPPNRPTSDYITRHINAYMNANLTTWAQANNTFPRNRLYDGC